MSHVLIIRNPAATGHLGISVSGYFCLWALCRVDGRLNDAYIGAREDMFGEGTRMESFRRFGLLFIEPTQTSRPIAHVYSKNGMSGDYPGAAGDLTLLSARAGNVKEFEAQIDRLQQDLEAVRIEARQKFGAFAGKRA